MNQQRAFINEESHEIIVKENEEEKLIELQKELKRFRNRARQRAYYHRQKELKKNEGKKKVPKTNAERQREFRQRKAGIYVDNKKRRKLCSNEEKVQGWVNQFDSQQLHIFYEQRNECIPPEVILHSNTGIPGDETEQDKMIVKTEMVYPESDDSAESHISIDIPRESTEEMSEDLKIEQRKLQVLEAKVAQRAELMNSENYQFLMTLLPEMEKLPSVHKMRLRIKISQILLDEISLLEQKNIEIQLKPDPGLNVYIKEEPL